MPSSTDAPPGAPVVPPQVRTVRFDRPLGGGAGAGRGWGDPALEASLADAHAAARAEGLAQGYAAGWAAGRQAALEREASDAADRARALETERRAFAARAQGLLVALADAARSAATSSEPTWDELAGVLADGALALARAALARELAAVGDDVERRLRAALGAVAGDGTVVVRVAPADLALLDGAELPEGVHVTADAGVAPGTIAVRTDAQRLLLDVPAAVAAAEEVLRS
ncbi:MAG TPA: hypothetical protein VE781_16825 [Kineosporiaceae bacterium]|jgi:flagellar assembly protein FliH|nr:hypothetical protein [Kineosporiaceae bacterium]